MATGIDNAKTSELLLESLMEEAKIKRDDIAFINATGYSRRTLDLADDTISEITAHAYGIRLTAPKEAENIGLIIDIFHSIEATGLWLIISRAVMTTLRNKPFCSWWMMIRSLPTALALSLEKISS